MQAYQWRITMAASISCLCSTIGCFVYVFAFGQARHAADRGPIVAITDNTPTEKVEVIDPLAPGAFCTTPNGENATCRAWYDCQVLMAALTSGGNASRDFAQASKCGETPLVCCGSKGSFSAPEPTAEDKLTLLPSTKYCGLQHTDDYFYDKNETSLDEFPWLAYILFENATSSAWHHGAKEVRCTGFLINRRYVITGRFCGSGADPITKVHLGRYNRHENVSCVLNDRLGVEECTNTSLEVKVAESVVPEVDSLTRIDDVYVDDIRLLRLEKPISYSDYVRPICLPLTEAARAKPGDELVTSGWGARSYNGLVKKRLKFALKTIKEKGAGTTRMYAVPKVENQSTCLGDDGGPLMFSYKHQWFAEGVVTMDVAPCENPDVDAAASRITPLTIEWILNNLRP